MYATDGTRGDTILGLGPNYRHTQQDLTELNGDGNRTRGRYGEDESAAFDEDYYEPSEYDEWQDYMGGDDWDHGQYDEY